MTHPLLLSKRTFVQVTSALHFDLTMKVISRMVIITILSLISYTTAQRTVVECGRACLETHLSNYLTALVEHNPSRLPTSDDVVYVENSQVLPIGSGEWKVAGALGKYNHVFSDPKSRQVAAITTLKENGVGLIYIVRLKLNDDGDISEIETQITRDEVGAARYENMTEPEAVWLEAVPPENRISRDKLIAQTNKYYTGMERNDPKGNYSFFHKDCNRLEDGLQTTNQRNGDSYGHSHDTAFASLGCEAQFQTGFLGFVTKIRDRRYPVVDEERQAVFAITIFDHNGTVRELPSVNGTSSPIPPYFDVPRTLAASEAFRLRDDKLYRIEMTLIEVPYGMRSAFAAGLPVDLSGRGTNLTTSTPCDRSCLEGLLYQVLQGMMNNNTQDLPLAKGVRYSENGQFLALGDGLWETLGHMSKSGVDSYAASFSDPATGTAAYWGVIQEQSTPGVLALRVKTDQGKITEIEAIVVRAEASGARGGTETLMRPPLPVEWEGDSLGHLDVAFKQNDTAGFMTNMEYLVESYFDGLETHTGASVNLAESCVRRDNGLQSDVSCEAQIDGVGSHPNGLFNGTGKVRDRRILVLDTNKGVAMTVALVDYPASSPGSLPATQQVPSTYMVPQLIRIKAGFITRVEGMVKWMPFGYKSAWTETNLNNQ